jgi:P-type Ca2+ transporter type 2C
MQRRARRATSPLAARERIRCFTTQIFQAVGLGYGEPGEGLMERRPRKPEEPILARSSMRWFAVAGLVMAAATLAVTAGAQHSESSAVARTMGLTTFAIANLAFSATARDELRSVLSLGTFNDRCFVLMSLMSVTAIILATGLGFLQGVLDTASLTGYQWLICIGAGLTIVAASEVRKFFPRRREQAAPA